MTRATEDYYNHAINIITLGDLGDGKLFKAPRYPGTHYNMSLELYSGDVLVEKSTINMTNVQGYKFEKEEMEILNF